MAINNISKKLFTNICHKMAVSLVMILDRAK